MWTMMAPLTSSGDMLKLILHNVVKGETRFVHCGHETRFVHCGHATQR